MPSQLGTLQLQITANATSATRSLKNLSSALGNLQNSMNCLSAGNVTSQLQSIGNAMQGITANNSVGLDHLTSSLSKLGGVKVGNAAANIGYLKDTLAQLAVSANSFTGFDSKSAENITQFAAAIAKLGGVNVQRASQGMAKLTTELSNMMATLAKAPKVSQNVIDMTNALAGLASQSKNLAPTAKTANASFTSFFSSFPSHQKKVFNLASAIGMFYAKFWMLIRAFKSLGKAIDLSSQLTEVQNVIDKSFGIYQDKLNSFANNAIDSFGISELTAKKIASRYQSMAGAMGFAQSKAANMSVEMTKLAADMASFYDVPVTDVAEDLEAAYTGLTRPLRKYGLDLTQATLKEWALRNGMNSNIQAMTQAEKTWLRYQYIMANTKVVQGDFLDTAESWHNVLTRLTESFKAFGTIVGGVFINAFKPVLQALNVVMAKVIQFAKVVSDALGFLFGWRYEEGGGISDVSDALDSAAGGAADTASGLGDAAKNAKKLKDYTMGIDELNILSPDDDSSSGSGGSGGAGGGASADADGGQWTKTDSALKDYMSDIKSLWGLGRYISDALSKAMEGIDWNSIYQKARNFGVGLADFLNGLITPRLFGDVGKTIAGCLNTALNAVWAFGVEFNWDNFGKSLAASLNEFFRTFDFSRLGSAINVWVKGLCRAITSFFENGGWEEIGNKIGELLAAIDFSGCASAVAEAIGSAIKSAFSLLGGVLDIAPIEAFIASFGGIALAIGGALAAIAPLAQTFENLSKIFELASAGVEAVCAAIGGISLPVVGAIAAIALFAGSFVALYSTNEEFRQKVIEVWSAVKDVISSTIDAISAVIEVFVAVGKAIWKAWGDDIEAIAFSAWEYILNLIKTHLNLIRDVMNVVAALFRGDWQLALDGIKQLVLDALLWLKARIYDQLMAIANIVESINNKIKTTTEAATNALKSIVASANDAIKQKVDEVWNAIKNKISETLTNVKDTASKILDEMKAKFSEIFGKIKDDVSEKISNVYTIITEKVGEAMDYLKNLPSEALTWGRDLIDNFVEGIRDSIRKVKDVVEDVADTVTDFIGFSEPEKGPLSDFHTYAPDMIDLFVKGINDNMYKVRNATAEMADNVAIRPNMTVDTPKLNGSIKGIEASGTVTLEAVLTSAIANMVDGKIVPTMQQNASDQKQLLERIADKDTTINLDGRRVNQQLTRQQSRSGISIRRS